MLNSTHTLIGRFIVRDGYTGRTASVLITWNPDTRLAMAETETGCTFRVSGNEFSHPDHVENKLIPSLASWIVERVV